MNVVKWVCFALVDNQRENWARQTRQRGGDSIGGKGLERGSSGGKGRSLQLLFH